MERDAKYVVVALFTLLTLIGAAVFVWWYSGRADRRDYQNYEVYFTGSVSGLSKGSPVRYLGVDVGRVLSLAVDRLNPKRVKVVTEIDSTAPINRATEAHLGLLGVTGLLYIDLRVNQNATDATATLPVGEQYPVIVSRKGDIEEFMERMPDAVGRMASVLQRMERVLADDNIAAFDTTLRNLSRTSVELPKLVADMRSLSADLRRTAADASGLANKLEQTVDQSQPDLRAALAGARATADKLSHTADSLDRIIAGNEDALSRFAAGGGADLQDLMNDARTTSSEVRDLAHALRENPSSLIRERKEYGVEIPR